MDSENLLELRKQYTGKSDQEIAEILCDQYPQIVTVIRYKDNEEKENYTHIVGCESDSQVYFYKSSPFYFEQEVLIDRRPFADDPQQVLGEDEVSLSEDDILFENCSQCFECPTEDSLQTKSDNQYYICPKCHDFYCQKCVKKGISILEDEVTHDHCPICEVKLIQALPGTIIQRSDI